MELDALIESTGDAPEAIEAAVRHLLLQNPGRLFQLLYRVDVSEQKLQQSVRGGEDVALVITRLLLERMAEKRASREKYGTRGDIPGEDRW